MLIVRNRGTSNQSEISEEENFDDIRKELEPEESAPVVKSNGLAFTLVGRRRTGKTTKSKELLGARPEGMNVEIYDINNEYGDIYPHRFDPDFQNWLGRMTGYGDPEKEVRDTYILVEEATIFFDTSSRFQPMKNLLVRARHTHNIIQVNFHSIASLPRNIANLLDFMTIFKTNDTIDAVLKRQDNPKIIQAFKNARDSNNPYYNETISFQ